MILNGYGRMLVVAVGPHSFYGRAILALQSEPEETPLQMKLTELANKIGRFGLIMAIFTCCVLITKLMITENYSEDGFDSGVPLRVVNVFVLCITIVVVAVPEVSLLHNHCHVEYCMMICWICSIPIDC